MLTRREFLELSAKVGMGAALLPAACVRPKALKEDERAWVNDIHSQLNRTRVHRIVRPDSIESLQVVVRQARAEGRAVSIAAGRHAMGGQQFGSDTILVDMSALNEVLRFDSEKGEVEVGSGIQWPELIDYLLAAQTDREKPWGIIQKQTGADRLSLGGALASNIHGRGLRYKPIVGDIESFTLVDARGNVRQCSRNENEELFRLAIGGYGLFGVVASVRLRLDRRRKLERVVEIIGARLLAARVEDRIRQGFIFGDFQYATDLKSETLLRKGVFSCYRPVSDSTPLTTKPKKLSEEDWLELIVLAHTDRARAFDYYAAYYLSTSGQIYWSDTHQLSTYIDDYHQLAAARLSSLAGGTEIITEIYIPRDALGDFLEEARSEIVEHNMNLIYGTVRWIERDDETFLAWASDRFACVVFNLHTSHDLAGIQKTKNDCLRLIDLGIRNGGSYYLTYHRWAQRDQVLKCYPQFPEFLRLKKAHDPDGRFQSDWYRHYSDMFADAT